MLPECAEKHDLIERCRSYLEAQSAAFKHAMGHAIWDAFGDAKLKPCHIQEQEQDSEQEPEPNEDIPPAVEHEFEEFWKCYPMRNGKRVGSRRP